MNIHKVTRYTIFLNFDYTCTNLPLYNLDSKLIIQLSLLATAKP